MTSPRALCSIALLCLIAACGSKPEAKGPPLNPRACQDAYEDLVKYFKSNPELRRPPGLQADAYINTCEQLPPLAQSCQLFSYMQKYPNECDAAIRQAPPEVMDRLAAIGGR